MLASTGRRHRAWWVRLDDRFEVGGLLLWILVCAVSVVFLVLTSISAYRKNQELDRTIEELQSQIRRMEEFNAELRHRREALASDPVYVERMLRKDMKMVREGEQVIRER